MSDTDSTYVAEEEGEEASAAQDGAQGAGEAQLTNQQLEELWQQLRRIDDQRRQRQDYFGTAQKPAPAAEERGPDLSTMTRIPDGLFAPYAVQGADEGNEANIEYLKKLRVYRPKIVTVEETKRFWEMYKNSLSGDQLEVLKDYLESQNGYIARQNFISRTRPVKE